MDPAHRDRIAFLRVCSGRFERGMKVKHLRLNREIKVSSVVTFMASSREQVEEAYAGDIIGLPNHGNMQIGDSFSEGEMLQFTGIPYFAPDFFRVGAHPQSAQDQAVAQGLAAAGRGGRGAGVQAGARQRPDPGRGRRAAVRSGRQPPAERIRRRCRVRRHQHQQRALGIVRRQEACWPISKIVGRPQRGLRCRPATWPTWRLPASTCA